MAHLPNVSDLNLQARSSGTHSRSSSDSRAESRSPPVPNFDAKGGFFDYTDEKTQNHVRHGNPIVMFLS